MESRFSKYKSNGKAVSDHIASVNNYINWEHDNALDLIEAEIQDLNKRIADGDTNKMFPQKIDLLIKHGETIEQLYNTYHFNREN